MQKGVHMNIKVANNGGEGKVRHVSTETVYRRLIKKLFNMSYGSCGVLNS